MGARGVDCKHEGNKRTDHHSNTNEGPEWDVTNPVKKNDNGRDDHRIHPDHNGRFAVNHVEGIDVHFILISKEGAEGFSRFFFGVVEGTIFFLGGRVLIPSLMPEQLI